MPTSSAAFLYFLLYIFCVCRIFNHLYSPMTVVNKERNNKTHNLTKQINHSHITQMLTHSSQFISNIFCKWFTQCAFRKQLNATIAIPQAHWAYGLGRRAYVIHFVSYRRPIFACAWPANSGLGTAVFRGRTQCTFLRPIFLLSPAVRFLNPLSFSPLC